MSIFETLRTANHNLFRNKIRTFLTILAIFVGSFTIILNVGINAGVNAFIDDQISTVGGENYLVIAKGDFSMQSSGMASQGEIQEYNENSNFSYMNQSDIDKISQLDGIDPDSISERGMGVSIDYIRGTKNDKKFVTAGIGSMPPGDFNVPVTAGEIPDPSLAENLIAIESGYPQALGYDKDEDIIGETVILGLRDPVTKKMREFEAKVVGVQASGIIVFNGNAVTTQLENEVYNVYGQYMSDEQKNSYSMLQASFDTSRYTEAEIKQILKDAGYSAYTVSDMVGMIKTFFDAILIVFTIFGAIALLAAAIGIINTLLMSVEERTREIGLDKALGMSSGRVFGEFATEALLLGFWGSVFGVAIAIAIGTVVNTAVHAPGGFLEAFPTFELFRFTIGNILPIILVVMLIALIAGTAPALKAAKKNPIEALRYE